MSRLTFLVLLGGSLLQAQTQQSRPDVTPSAMNTCASSDLSLGTDSEHGAFDRAGQSGTLLVLRNVSSKPCKILGAPRVTFADEDGALAVQPFDPFVSADGKNLRRGHGPAIPWIVIPTGAEVTSRLSWNAGGSPQGAVCVKATKILINLEDASSQSTPLSATLCSLSTLHAVVYSASWFVRDPASR